MGHLQLNLKSNKLRGKIAISGSKSISNRALIMKALAGSDAKFKNLSNSDDSRQMVRILKQIETCASSRIPLIIDARNAGTVIRFLTAFVANKEGKWLLTGTERMLHRPIGSLVEALITLGADIHYTGQTGFPPLAVYGKNFSGREVYMDASVSSQFISALMMIGPYLKGGLKIRFKTKPVSEPYLRMTQKMMMNFGIEVLWNENLIAVPEGDYQISDYNIEPDWSSASYWYEIAALSQESDLLLTGFTKASVQGDSICAELFEPLGVKTVFHKEGIRLLQHAETTDFFEHDFTGCPDLVPAIAVTCAIKGIPAKFTGVAHLKFKESDRILSLKTELQKIGTEIEKTADGFEIHPATQNPPKKQLMFETYDDHRIAMSMAPAFLKYNSVGINDPETVNKSYPLFWENIQQLGLVNVENF